MSFEAFRLIVNRFGVGSAGGTRAVVVDAAPDRIREGGRPLAGLPGVGHVTAGGDRTEIAIGSGAYRFEVDGGVE